MANTIWYITNIVSDFLMQYIRYYWYFPYYWYPTYCHSSSCYTLEPSDDTHEVAKPLSNLTVWALQNQWCYHNLLHSKYELVIGDYLPVYMKWSLNKAFLKKSRTEVTKANLLLLVKMTEQLLLGLRHAHTISGCYLF